MVSPFSHHFGLAVVDMICARSATVSILNCDRKKERNPV
jgi:hypothetical protein